MNRLTIQKKGCLVALVCLVIGLGTTPLAAQTSGNATLTVNLVNDVLQLTVNTNAINLNFSSAASYQNGVTSLVNNQLTVVSNRPYDLKVRAASANMVSGANTIPVSNVQVQPVSLAGGTSQVVSSLSTTDQSLATALPSTSSQAINLQYSTAAGNTAFLKPAGAYVTTITFTVIAN